MEELEKKLKKNKKGSSKAGWIFLIIAILVLLIGIMEGNPDKENWPKFDGVNNSEDYYKAEIYYLVGPFAEYTKNGEVVERLYSAYTTNNMYILIKTGKDTNLPILGEDVTEQNINTIEAVTIYGYGTKMNTELTEYLVQFWNYLYGTEIVTKSNYMEYFGNCYLNTEEQLEGTGELCYILAAIFGIIALAKLLSNRKNKKKIENTLKEIEEKGILESLKNEYSRENVQEYKKLNLELTPNYLINYKPELVIIPFADITNVYHSNMIDGIYQPFMYIALETKNGEKYYVAQKQLDAKKLQFDEVLEKIRSKVKQGGN